MAKEYDPSVKGYVNILNTGGVSKMQIPSNDKQFLGIVQSYLVFQILVFAPKSLSIEIAISDTSKTKRRLMFSAASKDIVINPLHSRIPLLNVPVGVWVNLSIDVLSFVSECFKSQTFRSIDFINLSASCKVRRIFSMRNSLMEFEKNLSDEFPMEYADVLPKTLSLPSSLPQENININIDKLKMLIESELKNSKDSISNIKDLNNDNFSNPSPLMRKNNNEANHKMINLKKAPYSISNPAQALNQNQPSNLTPNIVKTGGREFTTNSAANRSRSVAKPIKNNNGELLNKQEFIQNFVNKNDSASPNKHEDSNHKSVMAGNKQNIIKGKVNIKSLSGNNGVNKPNLFLNKMKVNLNNGVKNKAAESNQNNLNKFNSPTANAGVKVKLPAKIDNGKISQDNFNSQNKSNMLLNTLNYKHMDKWENSGSVKDNGGDSIEEIYEIDEKKSLDRLENKIHLHK